MIGRAPLLSLLLLLLSLATMAAQRPTAEVLQDLTDRAMIRIGNIQGALTTIAGAKEPLDVRRRLIKSTRKLFSEDATVEEKNRSGRSRKHPVEGYLTTLLYRGNKKPVIMDFMMMSALNPEGLTEVVQADGSVVYRGKVRFEQHYCRTSGVFLRTETLEEPECEYEDVTLKEVTLEISRSRTGKGVFWVIQIAEIKVISVR